MRLLRAIFITNEYPIRNEDCLLLSFIKPHKAIGTQTVGRWIKSVLKGAVMDIAVFKPHSTRHAASTPAFTDANVPIDDILKRAAIRGTPGLWFI